MKKLKVSIYIVLSIIINLIHDFTLNKYNKYFANLEFLRYNIT